MIDFYVRIEGGIVLFTPVTGEALDWVDEHLPDDCMTFGDAYVVEHRYAYDIMQGIINDGLTLEAR